MPELPEVETVVRSLRPHVAGRRIKRVELLAARVSSDDPARFAGARIRALTRRAKHILFELDHGWLEIHLRMTGKLLWNAKPGPYTRAVIHLDRGRVVFDDTRQFGRLAWRTAPPAHLGPEPFELSAAEFAARLAERKGRIKPLLLDQRFLAGLGNIYADESLHRARIHPLARGIGAARAARLHAAIVEVLEEAIAAGGSSISDYVDAEGSSGWFQTVHRVYGRTGEPCPACGAAVKRITLGQRGTHFCPRCQRP